MSHQEEGTSAEKTPLSVRLAYGQFCGTFSRLMMAVLGLSLLWVVPSWSRLSKTWGSSQCTALLCGLHFSSCRKYLP